MRHSVATRRRPLPPNRSLQIACRRVPLDAIQSNFLNGEATHEIMTSRTASGLGILPHRLS
jgi:hypothetical protein